MKPAPGHRLIALLLVPTLAALNAACASLSDNASTIESDCIISRSVRDYERLDNQNLIIYGSGNRAYHVVLVTPSDNLQREFEIGVLDAALGGVTDDRICPYGGDAIIVDGPIVETIRILSIERLDSDSLESLKVEFGTEDSGDDLVIGTVIQ